MRSEDDEWTWKFAPRATEEFEGLDTHIQVSSYHDRETSSRARAQANHRRIQRTATGPKTIHE